MQFPIRYSNGWARAIHRFSIATADRRQQALPTQWMLCWLGLLCCWIDLSMSNGEWYILPTFHPSFHNKQVARLTEYPLTKRFYTHKKSKNYIFSGKGLTIITLLVADT